MDHTELLHLHPTLEMLAQELTVSGIPCSLEPDRLCRAFRGARFFTGTALREDILYVLRPGDAERFPAERYACVCAFPIASSAGYILCPEQEPCALLDRLLEIFLQFQEMEQEIDLLVHRAEGTHALCELGARMLGNPICIHDDWFIITAMSAELPEVMPPERIEASNRLFIPRSVVEDFRYDPDYLDTYAYRTTQLWHYSPGAPACLYVNLWSGDVYRGRLLVVQYRRDFRLSDYMVAQCLTQRATLLLQRPSPGYGASLRSMDQVVSTLLQGRQVPNSDEALMLDTLGWSKTDKLVCIRIQNQQAAGTLVLEHVLHSDLFRAFPNSYIMFEGSQQCIILKLGGIHSTLSRIRHSLAPLCRDYCLYAGISSPVFGIRELGTAYRQADIALNQAFRLKCEKWIIPFSDCAMEYMLGSIRTPLPTLQLVAPELHLLMELDRDTGTQYFNTLRTYLILERDIPKTAAALIIHRTTLLYRLKKIRSLTELDLDDPRQRLYLLLSLHLLEQESVSR